MDKAPGRAKLCVDLHKLAESNPCLCDKLEFPSLNKSALLSLISLICPNCSGRNGGLKVKFYILSNEPEIAMLKLIMQWKRFLASWVLLFLISAFLVGRSHLLNPSVSL